MADLYPGWKKFKETLDELDKARKNADRQEKLAKGFEEALKGIADKCGCSVTKENIVKALKEPQGKNYDWSIWKGKHSGRFFPKDGQDIDDPQEWESPRDVNIGNNLDAVNGVPPNKNCKKQTVVWLDPNKKIKREGWNVSSDEDDCVWGWDPKEATADGISGVHLGLPFKAEKNCDCIVWLTTKYSFVECICEREAPATGQLEPDKKVEKCRFSIELGGSYGNWKVT